MKLEINGIYSQQDIKDMLDIKIMRGMSYSKDKNRLILVRNHVKSIYNDTQKENVIYYTGEGRKGNQSLDGANKRLKNSNRDSTDVHLFEVFVQKEYIYKGLVKLIDEPYTEIQSDESDSDRLVYIFPLELSDSATVTEIKKVESMRKLKEKRAKVLNDDELKKRTIKSQKETPGYSYAKSRVYQRSQYIVEFVERRANGICELCEKDAPFKKSNGKPYLEVHHIIQLSKGGSDTIDNAVALCPNCHRKMHSLILAKDIDKLKTKASSLDY